MSSRQITSDATADPPGLSTRNTTASMGTVIGQSSDSLWTVVVSGSGIAEDKIKFNFDDSSDKFVRRRVNTNPQLMITVKHNRTVMPVAVIYDRIALLTITCRSITDISPYPPI